MKISYNWLKQYLEIDLHQEKVAELLTNCGLEVESVEEYESVKGGLKGMVIGEVTSVSKHPDADKLTLTTIDVGQGTFLPIVCGAPNVAKGQKVVVATVGSKLYFNEKELEIKKAKIRGELSEGMICAEDELGLGNNHDGIMVLDPTAIPGELASDYFKIKKDIVFEIGLTPNRTDATSHYGVARDLAAVLNNLANDTDISGKFNIKAKRPTVDAFKPDNNKRLIDVIIEDVKACPRYTGLTITNITVKESPKWMQERLNAIGIRPINNLVDISNYVLHETGQPLHFFDADKIKGNKVIIKKLPDRTPFKTLDEIERELTSEDLMICNAEEGMCIAGVFGGISSGVTENTKNVFLESAYFNPTTTRKTSKHHDLHTDASFRFERGADPNITDYAIKRAALLIKEIAGGAFSSELVDVYPEKINESKVEISYENVDKLIGLEINRDTIKKILLDLEIKIISEKADGLVLSVP
ncbi:phenylalanine--tRNA ligase subunit beta, partial [candidate division KSB1 bacterium]